MITAEQRLKMIEDRRNLQYLYNLIEKAEILGMKKEVALIMQEIDRIKKDKARIEFKDRLYMEMGKCR